LIRVGAIAGAAAGVRYFYTHTQTHTRRYIYICKFNQLLIAREYIHLIVCVVATASTATATRECGIHKIIEGQQQVRKPKSLHNFIA